MLLIGKSQCFPVINSALASPSALLLGRSKVSIHWLVLRADALRPIFVLLNLFPQFHPGTQISTGSRTRSAARDCDRSGKRRNSQLMNQARLYRNLNQSNSSLMRLRLLSIPVNVSSYRAGHACDKSNLDDHVCKVEFRRI